MTQTVVHFTDSGAFGGSEQILLHLLAGLDRQRWRVLLFHHAEPGLEPLLEKARRLPVELRTVPRIETIRDIGNLIKFVQVLRAERASVLHAHLIWPLSCKYGLLGATLARVPAVVATAHLCMDLSGRRLLHAQPRLIVGCVDRYLAVSQAVAGQLCQDFGIPAAKVRLVPNGVALPSFDRAVKASLKANLSKAAGHPIVAMIARLEPRKGQKYLIEAAAQVPGATFVFVGDGPDRAALQTHARLQGVADRVVFLGYREDIPDILACANLVVLPSFAEGLPLSILEAMAAGKPVIASAIGGTDEAVVHGETGLLVPPSNASALAKAIRTILSDPDLARRLGAAGRERAYGKFSAETMVQDVSRVYEEILSTVGAG